jgi:hypothetical protein
MRLQISRLDRDSRALAEKALETNEAQTALHYLVVGGQRRAFEIQCVPMATASRLRST